jgi:hypothetical protein
MGRPRVKLTHDVDAIAKELYDLVQRYSVADSMNKLVEKYNVSLYEIRYIKYVTHSHLFLPSGKLLKNRVQESAKRLKPNASSKTNLVTLIAEDLNIDPSTVWKHLKKSSVLNSTALVDDISIEARVDNSFNPKNLVITFTISLKELRKRSKQ